MWWTPDRNRQVHSFCHAGYHGVVSTCLGVFVGAGRPVADAADLVFHQQSLCILLAVNVILLVLGALIEGTALMIVLVPLLMPTVKALGIDPVHFGIIVIVNLSIGTLTPPVGTVMLMVCNIAKVRVGDFTRQAFSMYLALFIMLALITYVPIISTYLAH